MKNIFLVVFLFGLLSVPPTQAGLLGLIGGYGLCQTACNAAWVTCCTAAGVTAGAATAGLGAPAAVLACSAAQGACMTSCAAAFLAAPTP